MPGGLRFTLLVKFKFPQGQLLATGLLLVFKLSVAAQSNPTPSPSDKPPPNAVVPPRETQPVRPAPAFVAPFNPAPLLPASGPAVPAPFVSARPDLQRIARAIPHLEITRGAANRSQKLAPRAARFDRVLLAGTEPVTLALQFHSLLTGKPATVRSSPEIALQPADGIVGIGPNGKLAFQVQLAGGALKGRIFLYVDGVSMEIPVARVPLSMVVSRETPATQQSQ
jgi:hypothetical protein